MNADRFADIVITSRGALIVVFGAPDRFGRIPLDLLAPPNVWSIDGAIEPNEWLTAANAGGFTTAGALGGDGNGDGRADVLAGARMADHNGRVNSGSAYLFLAP